MPLANRYMGNLLAATTSIFVPLINSLIVVPFIFHPERWGTVPWQPPSWVVLTAVTFLLNISALLALGTISGMMTTKNKCDKVDILQSMRRSMWVITGWLFGNLVLTIMPFIKAPLLAIGLWMPYGGWIIHGILVSASVLLFGAVGNSILRSEVCQKRRLPPVK